MCELWQSITPTFAQSHPEQESIGELADFVSTFGIFQPSPYLVRQTLNHS